MMSISFHEMKSPIGRLFLAATPRGLCRIAIRPGSEQDFLQDLETRFHADVLHRPSDLAPVVMERDEYFLEKRQSFLSPIDWTLIQGFQRRVLEQTFRIPFGQVKTYGDIAREIAQPGPPRRAVGKALGRNPIPIIIPCHRVVAEKGIGGFTGGLEIKRALMRIEGIPLAAQLALNWTEELL